MLYIYIYYFVKRQYKPLYITNCSDMFILFLQLENKFLEGRDNAAYPLLGISFPISHLFYLQH